MLGWATTKQDSNISDDRTDLFIFFCAVEDQLQIVVATSWSLRSGAYNSIKL